MYFQSNILLLADLSDKFSNICHEISELDPAHFLTAPGLAWQPALIKTKVKLIILIGINMLIMAEKCIRGGIYHSVYRYGKISNKYMNNYDKNVRIATSSILGCK